MLTVDQWYVDTCMHHYHYIIAMKMTHITHFTETNSNIPILQFSPTKPTAQSHPKESQVPPFKQLQTSVQLNPYVLSGHSVVQ